jgi:hypothetical protein
MSQPEWNARLTNLPLVLAGPLLRKTTATSVTVWVALKSACTVELQVYETTNAGQQIGACLLTGRRTTVAIGQFLHIAAITAQTSQTPLQPDCIYAYDLHFSSGSQDWDLDRALVSPALPSANISYFAHQKPTFTLPPERLQNLQIVQGSCRKPHGDGYDALPILDDLIAAKAQSPRDSEASPGENRPHQLFLTGDQIYGDDVAEPMLWVASALGDALLGWEEKLPIRDIAQANATDSKSMEYRVPAELPPGTRADVATAQAGFTAGLRNKRDKIKSHLFSLGEYYASYLLAWSPVCWAIAIPQGRQMRRQRQAIRQWNYALEDMQQFLQTLPQVRRALANVPTYMMFDDHEVSDDWNLNQAWCLRVYGKPLGRRVVQNALLAYGMFQGWGNTPEQFAAGRSGEKLLEAAQKWSHSAGQDEAAAQAIAQYTGMPFITQQTGLPQFVQDESVLILSRHPDAVTWHYTIKSHCHEVIVLDTRTWRGYPTEGEVAGIEVPQAIAPPMLLCPKALAQQVTFPLQQPHAPKGTFLVLPTNLFGLQAIDWIHHWQLRRKKVFSTDVGDAWNVNMEALARLLTELFSNRRSLVVLSGDIHYSTIVRLYHQQLASPMKSAGLVQLTCSALKNEELATRILHTRLKDWLLPEPIRRWIGWQNPPHMKETKGRRLPASSPQPDWFATLEWIPRQTTRRMSERAMLGHPIAPDRYFWRQWWRRFWLWLQDGQEVVGVNNLGVVSFHESEADVPTIVHTIYWLSFWHPPEVFYSRFDCELISNPDSHR